MCIYFTSHETQLEGNDAAIFQQKCRAMKLSIQLPVDVTVLKNSSGGQSNREID